MKKLRIILGALILIIVILFGTLEIIFQLNAHSKKEDSNGTPNVLIDGEKYQFIPNWKYLQVGERIGFIRGDHSFIDMLFTQRGLYSIKGDEDGIFRWIRSDRSRDYNLMVRQDVTLPSLPKAEDIGHIEVMNYSTEQIKVSEDRELISKLLELHYIEDTAESGKGSEGGYYDFKFVNKKYPPIYYNMMIQQSEDKKIFWVKPRYSWSLIQVPEEYIQRLSELVE